MEKILTKKLKLDLNIEAHCEFLQQVKKCLFYEKRKLMLNRMIYYHINWGRDKVEIFDYAIKLLETPNGVLAKKLFDFFDELEKKDTDPDWVGYEFYPLLLFYMIRVGEIDSDEEFNFFDENNGSVLKTFFELEPNNVDWSYFYENLNTDCLEMDVGDVCLILDIIFDNLTIKNTNVLHLLKSIIDKTLEQIKEDDEDYLVNSQHEVGLFEKMKTKIERSNLI